MDFEELKRSSLLQVLFKAARLANEEGIRRVRETTGTDDFRMAHTTLFPHIPFDGIRLTDLAERVDSSKQAVLHIVNELETMGVVERVPDPQDGRAKLIRFTELGRDGLTHGLGVLKSIEQELVEVIGESDVEATHRALLGIIEHLED